MFGDGYGDFDMSMSGGGRGYGRGYNRYRDYYGYGPYGGYGGGPWDGYGGYPATAATACPTARPMPLRLPRRLLPLPRPSKGFDLIGTRCNAKPSFIPGSCYRICG